MFFSEELLSKLYGYSIRYYDRPKLLAVKTILFCLRQFMPTFSKKRNATSGEITMAAFIKGGVGDSLFCVRYLYELTKRYNVHLPIDIYSDINSESMNGLIEGYSFAKSHKKSVKYTKLSHNIIMELSRFPRILYIDEKYIHKYSNELWLFCKKIMTFQRDYMLFFAGKPFYDFLGTKFSMQLGLKRQTQIDTLKIFNLDNSNFKLLCTNYENTLEKFFLHKKRFLTVQRGLGDLEINKNQGTRLWPKREYELLLKEIKHHLPEITIVQLGSEKSSALDGVDIDLRGKTSFSELKVLLDCSSLHIDGDCGMVHLRHFLSAKPSLVIFGPTDEHWLGYDENINLSKRPCPNACEWLTPYWRERCIISGNQHTCLNNIHYSDAFKSISKHLEAIMQEVKNEKNI